MRLLIAIPIALAAGAVAAVVAIWLMVVPVFWGVVIGLPVMAGTLLALVLAGVAAPTWQAVPAPPDSLTLHQASSLSTRFAEATKDPQRFRNRVQPRLRSLALSALRQQPATSGVTSLHDAKAREALGTELYTLLTDRDARLPSPHRLAELLSRLEGK
jgi:hypothetical protein